MDFKFGKLKLKIIIAAAAVVAAGGTCAVIMSHESVASDNSIKSASKPGSKADSSWVVKLGNAASLAASGEEEEVKTEEFSFMTFEKAPVDSYDMHYYVSAKKKAEEKKVIDPDNFKVEHPKDEGEYYDIHNDPLNFTETRSIAGEYYTVHDIISGTTLSGNAHDLICQMVYSEIGELWGEEAIKAQAVAAYTCLRYNASHGIIPDIGLKPNPTAKIERCVSAVEGQVILYNGEIINSVYSASTAGYSTTSRDIWGGNHPYLQRVISKYDSKDPNWGIEKKFTKAQVSSILSNATGLTLSDDVTQWFTITGSYSGKYVRTVSIGGKDGTSKTVSGGTMCSLFGLKSTAMDISFKDGVFTFTTYGWGHGVGMSQWGACYYAEAGWTYDQILTHYYVNTTLGLSDYYSNPISIPKQPEEPKTDDKTETDPKTTQPTESQPAADPKTETDTPAADPETPKEQTADTEQTPDTQTETQGAESL